MALIFRTTLLVILLISALSDLKSYRVDNLLILLGLLIGTVLRIGENGGMDLIRIAADIIYPVIIFFLLFAARVLGAGDIKLISLISLYESFSGCMIITFWAFVMAALWGTVHLYLRGELFARISNLHEYIKLILREKKILSYPVMESSILPLSVFLFLSTYVYAAATI